MFTRISSLILAILMFLVFLGSAANIYVFAASVVILIFATLAINFKRLNFTWPHLMLPLIYLLSAGSVFAIISSPQERVVFLLLASITFYLLEIKLGKESHFLQNIYLLSTFALYLALFALQFYFNLRVWYVVPIAFVITYLLSIQGFAGFSLPSKKYFHLLMAMVAGEATWGLSFWPTHYFVNAVILFCFFYVLWLFSFSAFFGKLTRQKVYWQLTLVAIVLILTLSTAAWRPLK
ncbi:MAG: hypothetical protein KW802_02750 [Candidatus Doudnabacteria bacterium]|nr:hypothetical protein [Candidatus Doudnabacteria bacterium]